jgi:hypothetical protein
LDGCLGRKKIRKNRGTITKGVDIQAGAGQADAVIDIEGGGNTSNSEFVSGMEFKRFSVQYFERGIIFFDQDVVEPGCCPIIIVPQPPDSYPKGQNNQKDEPKGETSG